MARRPRSWVRPEVVAESIDGQTLLTTLRSSVERWGDESAFRWREGDDWRTRTFREYAGLAGQVAGGLRRLGVGRGDRVSLLVGNRPEFFLADMGTLFVGATPTSIYGTSSAEQIEYQLTHAGSRVVVVDGPAELERVERVRRNVPALEHVVCIDDPAGIDARHVVAWSDVLDAPMVDLDDAAARANPSDVATLIYTSGTTGPPKAAMLTHRNLLASVESYRRVWGTDFVRKRVISYLPLAHIGERGNSHYTALVSGFEVTTCPAPTMVFEYLRHVRPNMFFGPPRIWEKLYVDILGFVARDDVDLTAELARVLEVGGRVGRARRDGGDVTPEDAAAWEELRPVVRRIKEEVALEDLEVGVTAAAAMSRSILDAFVALDVPLCDSYGMSECFVVAGDTYEVRPGTVGRPAPGVEVRIAADDEILVRSNGVFIGYLDDEVNTSETLADGWLHTGDLGAIDDDGYLTLIGRKKDLIITAGGKNISPANLEAMLTSFPLIGGACVIGDARPYVVALLVLDPLVAPLWAMAKGIADTDVARLRDHEAVRAEIEGYVAQANERLSRVEQIKRFEILADVWAPDSEVMTPTMKLRRHVVMERYHDVIDAVYARAE